MLWVAQESRKLTMIKRKIVEEKHEYNDAAITIIEKREDDRPHLLCL